MNVAFITLLTLEEHTQNNLPSKISEHEIYSYAFSITSGASNTYRLDVAQEVRVPPGGNHCFWCIPETPGRGFVDTWPSIITHHAWHSAPSSWYSKVKKIISLWDSQHNVSWKFGQRSSSTRSAVGARTENQTVWYFSPSNDRKDTWEKEKDGQPTVPITYGMEEYHPPSTLLFLQTSARGRVFSTKLVFKD